ncbi:MAG: hypothetical protein AUJ47_01435 [Candidatus Marinimicrobia bacterium CG1_02_48_14]|nr:MAG: hypothetical protein AUJ47_01435 [Candidatus Marinimicrobia bacterium CG1_02_48_14]PJA54181.1 MAG: hypothetical protein CO167_05235 [Candidatus Marinimicrobia bacterium CG_4_9_14_3_um_filter_48_9]
MFLLLVIVYSLLGFEYHNTGFRTILQPDGTTFTAESGGSFYLPYNITDDGYQVVQDVDGWWYYAILDADGDFTPSAKRAAIDNPPNESYHLTRSPERVAVLNVLADSMNTAYWNNARYYREEIRDTGRELWTFGIVLVRFTDVGPHTNSTYPNGFPASAYTNMFFSQGHYYDSQQNGIFTPTGDSTYGSFYDYWHEQSQANLEITGQLVNSVVNDEVQWLQLDHTKTWYDSLLYPHGLSAIISELGLNSLLVVNGGQYDFLGVVYASNTLYTSFGISSWPGGLWPQAPYPNIYLIGEASNNYFSGIGGHVHEFGHLLDLSDHWFSPLFWDLMSVGDMNGPSRRGGCPAGLTPFEKIQKGWTSVTDITQNMTPLTLHYDYNNPIYYRIPSGASSAGVLLEVRLREGFDQWTPIPPNVQPDNPNDPNGNDGGLLVWNSLKLLPADDEFAFDGWDTYVQSFPSYMMDPFPIFQGQDLHDGTIPSLRYQNQNSNVALRNLQWDDDAKTISFDLYVDNWGGPPATPQDFGLSIGNDNHPELSWSANTEPDFDHFMVTKIYTNIGGSYTFFVNVGTTTHYVDNDFTIQRRNGQTQATYTVKAIDTGALESPVSHAETTSGLGPFFKPTAIAQNPEWVNYTNGAVITASVLSMDGNAFWSGTTHGLARVDLTADTVTIFTKSNSGLPANGITALAVDSTNRTWIGTNSGLVTLQDQTWTVYTTYNSGLPGNTITAITETGTAAVWIGTNAGLAYFDGTAWSTFTQANSGLPSNNISALEATGSGALWIGTDNGLAFLNDGSWTAYTAVNSGLPGDRISAIAVENETSAWIGTREGNASDGGLAYFDGTDWTVYTTGNSDLPNNSISSLNLDNASNLWVGAWGNSGAPVVWGGLARFNGTEWVTYHTSNSGLASDLVNTLSVGTGGQIWIGTMEGLVRFDGTDWRAFNTSNSMLPDNQIQTIAVDSNNVAWIGAGGPPNPIRVPHGGIVRFNGTAWNVFSPDSSNLPGYMVTAMTLGPDGDPWVGTNYFGALAHFDGADWNSYEIPGVSAIHNLVLSLAHDLDGSLWIGTNGGGLVNFEGQSYTNFTTLNSGLPSDYVTALSVDHEGWIWIGTANDGLVRYDGLAWEIYNTANSGLPSDRINTIITSADQSLWLGTPAGLVHYDMTDWTLFNHANSSLLTDTVTVIAEDTFHSVWAGSGDAVVKFDGVEWSIFSPDNSGLPGSSITALAVDSNGNKWIGTASGGLAIFNENGVTVATDPEHVAFQNPKDYALQQNYPNPFNPATIIRFTLPKSTQAELTVIDLLGRVVETLAKGRYEAGMHQVAFDASDLPSGMYFYRLTTSDFTQTRKMLLVK